MKPKNETEKWKYLNQRGYPLKKKKKKKGQ